MSKYLSEREAMEMVSCIKQFTPVVTGNLKSSVQFVRMTHDGFIVGVGIKKTGMAGANPALYAAYVNYGYRNNPKSKKLKRDYMFVEKAINSQWGQYINRVINRKKQLESFKNDEEDEE